VRALVLATGNEKKRRELEQIAGDRFAVRTLRDVDLQDLEIVEDADTFAGNAEKKAVTVLDALRAKSALADVVAVLADDSGLCVDALDGAPGVRSARFAADHDAGSGDEANNALLLEKLADVTEEQRGGRFACAICVALPDGRKLEAFGTVEGRIGRAPRGDGGFGYDPLFWPDERPGVTTAELPADEKNAISHRGRAVREAMQKLDAALS
jgi:XTP/dITP diphosphohydrolase